MRKFFRQELKNSTIESITRESCEDLSNQSNIKEKINVSMLERTILRYMDQAQEKMEEDSTY